MEKFIVEAGKGEKCRLMKLVNLEKDKGLRLSPKMSILVIFEKYMIFGISSSFWKKAKISLILENYNWK